MNRPPPLEPISGPKKPAQDSKTASDSPDLLFNQPFVSATQDRLSEPDRTRFLSGFIDTYLRLSPQESLLFQAQADTLLDRTEKRKVMELTTSWKEEGRQEGRLELVFRLLRRRCGALSPAIDAKIRTLPAPQLEDLAEAVLDFSSLGDLELWLRSR